MVMFAPSDVRVIAVHTDNGGCGVPHEVGDSRSIDCPPCEAWLAQTPSLGWANHPGGVKLTCDEIAQSERDEREAKRVGMANLANQFAIAAAGLPAQSQAQAPSLVEQILALSPQEKAAVLVLLGGAQPPALDAAPAQPITLTFDEQDVATPEEADAALKPKNRGGRPRKQVPAAASAA